MRMCVCVCVCVCVWTCVPMLTASINARDVKDRYPIYDVSVLLI